jgi:hypothetical protein
MAFGPDGIRTDLWGDGIQTGFWGDGIRTGWHSDRMAFGPICRGMAFGPIFGGMAFARMAFGPEAGTGTGSGEWEPSHAFPLFSFSSLLQFSVDATKDYKPKRSKWQ